MLELRNLVFDIPDAQGNPQHIIDDISLVIPDDRFTVITGSNGGGKSTLAKLIMGIERPTGGNIIFNDQDITDLNITERARLGIGYGFQEPARFKGLKVKNFLISPPTKSFRCLHTTNTLPKWVCAPPLI